MRALGQALGKAELTGTGSQRSKWAVTVWCVEARANRSTEHWGTRRKEASPRTGDAGFLGNATTCASKVHLGMRKAFGMRRLAGFPSVILEAYEVP